MPLVLHVGYRDMPQPGMGYGRAALESNMQ